MLAGEKDAEGRRHAAECLAEGAKTDQQKNLPILRNLLADNDQGVQIRASVSLYILGNDSMKQPILKWLDQDRLSRREVVGQFKRVKDTQKLGFARARLEAIANDAGVDDYVRKGAKEILAPRK